MEGSGGRARVTSDQAPVLQCEGQARRLQGRRASGRSPPQYLLCTERSAAALRGGWTQRTVRTWKPRLPQERVQCSHSSDTHLRGRRAGLSARRMLRGGCYAG